MSWSHQIKNFTKFAIINIFSKNFSTDSVIILQMVETTWYSNWRWGCHEKPTTQSNGWQHQSRVASSVPFHKNMDDDTILKKTPWVSGNSLRKKVNQQLDGLNRCKNRFIVMQDTVFHCLQSLIQVALRTYYLIVHQIFWSLKPILNNLIPFPHLPTMFSSLPIFTSDTFIKLALYQVSFKGGSLSWNNLSCDKFERNHWIPILIN